MFLDGLMLFDPANTAITVSAASVNVFDAGATNLQNPTGNQSRDLGAGDEILSVFAIIQQAFAAAGAATLQASIQGAPDNAGAPGAFFDMMMTGVLPKANLTLGRELLRTPLPMNTPAASNTDFPPRFYRLNYTVATGPFTAGQVESGLTTAKSRQASFAYAAGFAPQN